MANDGPLQGLRSLKAPPAHDTGLARGPLNVKKRTQRKRSDRLPCVYAANVCVEHMNACMDVPPPVSPLSTLSRMPV
jgi:hypothetical protein